MRLHEHAPLRDTPLAFRLLIAAAIAVALVLWLRTQPAPTYDLRVVQRCLQLQGANVRRSGPTTLTIDGELAVRLDTDKRVLAKGPDPHVDYCLDRIAGGHLRLLP